MKKSVKLAVLALCACLLLAGCSEKESVKKSPVKSVELAVGDCYTYTRNADGTYSYSVTDREGNVFHSTNESHRAPTFAVVNKDVLVIYGKTGAGEETRWAQFCDVQRKRVSGAFGGYLAVLDNRVAFVDKRTDAYHVFVCDPFSPDVYLQVCTLEGLTVADGDHLAFESALGADGVLSITYATSDGNKTVTVDLKD